MDGLLLEYLAIAVGLGGVALSYLVAPRSNEKLSPCGFDAFEDARRKFDVRLIAVLFIIFPRGYS